MRNGMAHPGIRVLGCLLLCATAACRTSTPARVTLPSGETLRGSATTSVNGQFYVKNERTNCTGTFEGRNVGGIGLTAGRKSTVTIQCSNGKTGASDDRLYDSGRAQLRMNDGSQASIVIGE